MAKFFYDRLVSAEWIEKVTGIANSEQNGVWEQEIKLIVFSRLYRELLKEGKISMDEIIWIVALGKETEIRRDLEIS